jgi:hypothetical protein
MTRELKVKNLEADQQEKVTLEVPKNVMEFLRACCRDPIAYLEHSLASIVQADLDNQAVFTETLAEKFNLDTTFKELEKASTET